MLNGSLFVWCCCDLLRHTLVPGVGCSIAVIHPDYPHHGTCHEAITHVNKKPTNINTSLTPAGIVDSGGDRCQLLDHPSRHQGPVALVVCLLSDKTGPGYSSHYRVTPDVL